MPSDKLVDHPLRGDRRWTYLSYLYLKVQTRFQAVAENGAAETIVLNYAHYCREVHASQTLQLLKNTLKGRRLELAAPGGIVPGECTIGLKPDISDREKPFPKEMVPAWDALVGLPCLLLDPARPTGDWWKTSNPDNDEYWEWRGTTNFFLHHPALISIVLGLLRQVYFLHRAGRLPEVLKDVDREKVSAILTSCDRDAALRLVKKLRPWIQVPAGSGGNLNNYAVPWYARKARQISYWERFLSLFRAVERHGLKEVFGGEPTDVWMNSYTNGAFSYWGGDKSEDSQTKVSEHHKRLVRLGAVKRKDEVKRSSGEPR